MEERRIVIYDANGNIVRVEVHHDLAFRRKLFVRAFAVTWITGFLFGGWVIWTLLLARH